MTPVASPKPPTVSNAQAWEGYDYYAGELTKFARQIAFGGAAICWLFKRGDMSFPSRVYSALACIVAYCVLDVVQYFIGACLHRWWIRKLERAYYRQHKSLDGEYCAPAWLDRPAFLIFNVKILVLASAFWFLWAELMAQR